MYHLYLAICVCTLIYLFMMQLTGMNVGLTFWGCWLLIIGMILITIKFLVIVRHKYVLAMKARKEADKILRSRI